MTTKTRKAADRYERKRRKAIAARRGWTVAYAKRVWAAMPKPKHDPR
jgi:hypothetical protein